jgi:hypothetical protein
VRGQCCQGVSLGDRESDLGLGTRRDSPRQASSGEVLIGGEEVDGGANNRSAAAAWGQRGTAGACGSSQSCCGAGGGQAMLVDGKLPRRKKAVGKVLSPMVWSSAWARGR